MTAAERAEASPQNPNSNVIVFQDEELKKRAAGAIVFWTLQGDVRIDALDKALEVEGSPAIRPDAPSNVVALRRAVEIVGDNLKLESHGKEGGKWRLVAPGAKEEAKEETADSRRKKSLVYDVKLTAMLEGNAKDVLVVENLTGNPMAESDLRTAMAYAKGSLDTSDISGWLCEKLTGLGAVRLRESGGFYFVPVDTVHKWEKITRALKTCGKHNLYSIPAMKTKDAMEAILAAVTAESPAQTTPSTEQPHHQADRCACTSRATARLPRRPKLSQRPSLAGKPAEAAPRGTTPTPGARSREESGESSQRSRASNRRLRPKRPELRATLPP